MEQGLIAVYNRIPKNAKVADKNTEENINLIAQTID
jgi:hypothetical protein